MRLTDEELDFMRQISDENFDKNFDLWAEKLDLFLRNHPDGC